MANTLTGLMPDFIEGLNVVSRELIGAIPAVTRDARIDRVAMGQNVTVPVAPIAGASANNTPAVAAPDSGDAVMSSVQVTIAKSKHQPIRFNGEETLGLTNSGAFSTVLAGRTYEAMRALVNEIEADVVAAATAGASIAYGTAGTAPFGTANDFTDFAGARQIMELNGAPLTDLQLVMGASAMFNLRGKQPGLFKVNEAGSSDMLRNGLTDRVQGMALRNSAAVGVRTKGTGSGYLVNGALSAGATVITVDTGSGTILAGDVVTFAGDATKYVVTSALASNTFTIGRPLLVGIADNAAVTVGNNFTNNLVFDRGSVVLATRMPAMPQGGDSADDVTSLTDPISGITFEFALYRQFLQNVIHVRAAWGAKVIKSQHVGLLLG